MTTNKWYDKGQLLSHKAFLNMLVGQRGNGKTYSFKTWAIDDWKKTKKQFVWLRRFGTEIKMLKGEKKDMSFFGDIASKYPNDNFEMKGDNKSGKFLCNGEIMGYYFALTTSSIAKSSSYPLVDKIIFDEFLIVGNTYHYLNEEVVMLLEFMDTIFRDRETKENAVVPRGVYLIGNNVTIANPYFLYFNVPPLKTRFYHNKQRGLLVEMSRNQAFIDEKKQTRFGRLIEGTEYYDYNVENKPMLDNDRFIAKKTPKCEFYCAIDYKGKTYGFWHDYKNGLMYANRQYDPSSYSHYALSRDDHSINTFLIKSMNNTAIKTLTWLFRAGCMYFEDQQIKAQVYEMLSYFIR